jgi:diphthine synthase
MITFIGLGLYDHRDISVKGLECIRKADYVVLEAYTSALVGTTLQEMQDFYSKTITILSREDVEQNPKDLLLRAETEDVVFLTGGDPMVSTTHMDLRMRACSMGINTAIIHGASISSAVCGLSGLQNYRFGKSCSLPFPHKKWAPTTPLEVIAKNLDLDLHTLVYLDIQPGRFMTVPEAVSILDTMAGERGISIPLYVGIARAGSNEPRLGAGDAAKMKSVDLGPPLHILVVPGDLHIMEREYLEMFAGL